MVATESSAAEAAAPPDGRAALRASAPRLWREALYVLGFYFVYSAIRNQFGSAAVSPSEAYDNALRIIDWQRDLGMFVELEVQRAFLDHEWFIRSLNIFYGSLHFVVTIGVMVYLFVQHPQRYVWWRTVLAWMTGLALVGFALFPLMPPRLLNAGGTFGWSDQSYDFVDTLAEVGGLWSFSSDGMAEISNQYAAMPSLHVGWALWCTCAMWGVTRQRWLKAVLVAYPVLTTFTIVVTGNHFLLDAVGGVLVFGLGMLAAEVALWTIHRVRHTRVEPVEPTP